MLHDHCYAWDSSSGADDPEDDSHDRVRIDLSQKHLCFKFIEGTVSYEAKDELHGEEGAGGGANCTPRWVCERDLITVRWMALNYSRYDSLSTAAPPEWRPAVERMVRWDHIQLTRSPSRPGKIDDVCWVQTG